MLLAHCFRRAMVFNERGRCTGNSRGPPVTARTSAGSKAEVLVSRDQLRAIARLQELVAKGDLTDANSPPVGSAPDAVTDIRPAPLTIAPLTVSAVETVTGGEGSKARLER